MRIIHKGLILVGVPLVIAIAVIASMYGLILQTESDRLEEQRERHISEDTCRIQTTLFNAGMALKESILDHDPSAKSRFKACVADLVQTKERLQQNHSTKTQADRSLNEMSESIDAWMNSLRDLLSTKRLNLSLLMQLSQMRGQFTNQSMVISSQAHQLVANVLADIQKSPEREAKAFRFQTGILLAGVIASILSGIMLARWFISDIVARLQVITDNTMRMGRGEALNPPLCGNDEITELDAGFHRTADALRRAMAKERALFESASEMICVLDADFKFAAVNPACMRVLGYAPEDVTCRSCFDIIPEEDRQLVRQILESTKTAKPARSFEIRITRKDGQIAELMWSVYWSHMDQALYTVAHDITERKQLERLKKDFLAMVSHDLRSPLTSIFGTFQLIAAGVFGELSDQLREKVDGCKTNTNRLVGLVNDLLDIEKLESGKLELNRESTSTEKILAQAVAEVLPLADRRAISLSVDSQCGDYFMDADRIVQVLVNLLSNAIKFSPDGKSIQVRGCKQRDGLEVQIIDEGRGVPEAQRQAIFERFKQVKAEDGRRKAGTGLGLPICKQIIEQHGGSIGVDERPGGGSIFWFRLPPTTAPTEATASTEAPAPVATGIIETLARLSSVSDAANADTGESSTSMQALPVTGQSKKVRRRAAPLSNMRLIHKGALLVFIPVVFELAFAASLFGILTNAYAAKQREIHQHLVSGTADDFLLVHAALISSMSAELTKTPQGWKMFHQLSLEAAQREAELAELTSQDPEQAAIMRDFEQVMTPVHDFLDRAHRRVERDGATQQNIEQAFAAREDLEGTGSIGCKMIRTLIDSANTKLDQNPGQLDTMTRQISFFLLAGLAMSVAIGGGSAFLFSSSVNQRLKAMADNFKRLEAGDPLAPTLAGGDEVSRLDQFIHTMSDALREARRKERAVFNNAQDILIELTEDGIISRVNPASFNTWGFKPDEIAGKPLQQLLPPESQEQFAAALREVVQSGHLELEAPVLRFNQTLCHMRWSLSCSNQRQTIIGVGHDVSQRKELERLKQEFLSMVSHDLRTPLSAIQGTAEMIVFGVFGDLPEQAKAQMAVVERNCQRLLTLINDLLDIEKMESGNFKLTIAPTNTSEVIDRAIEGIATIAEEKSISINIHSKDLPFIGDGDRLVQVVINLLSNAIKFSPEGASIDISLQAEDSGVKFIVTDHGRGIPEGYLSSIFERYKQVESGDARRGQGTGLGLPICKQIIEQHGGQIGVESTPGGGSTFWFMIPKAVLSDKQSVAQA